VCFYRVPHHRSKTPSLPFAGWCPEGDEAESLASSVHSFTSQEQVRVSPPFFFLLLNASFKFAAGQDSKGAAAAAASRSSKLAVNYTTSSSSLCSVTLNKLEGAQGKNRGEGNTLESLEDR